eukprot:5193620-Pleurochrysis_carterae.AAC.1
MGKLRKELGAARVQADKDADRAQRNELKLQEKLQQLAAGIGLEQNRFSIPEHDETKEGHARAVHTTRERQFLAAALRNRAPDDIVAALRTAGGEALMHSLAEAQGFQV